jgi:hypothetical protein
MKGNQSLKEVEKKKSVKNMLTKAKSKRKEMIMKVKVKVLKVTFSSTKSKSRVSRQLILEDESVSQFDHELKNRQVVDLQKIASISILKMMT